LVVAVDARAHAPACHAFVEGAAVQADFLGQRTQAGQRETVAAGVGAFID